MVENEKLPFDTASYLACNGPGRRLIQLTTKQPLFAQGDPADTVFYLHKGRVKITMVSKVGKEATISLLADGDFVGEEALGAAGRTRQASATAVVPSTVLKIRRDEMLRVLHEEREFSDRFLAFMLDRNLRFQADLVDQLFNSSEKRLARILLLMAEYGQKGDGEPYIPKISQETLAEMIGTTRSRVSFFMNRFRRMGFIEYNGRIQVHKSLLNVLSHDQAMGNYAGRSPVAAGREMN